MGKLEFVEGVGTTWTPDIARFECRDIGYGVETGEVLLPAWGPADWTGKRPYSTVNGERVFLFDDELQAPNEECPPHSDQGVNEPSCGSGHELHQFLACAAGVCTPLFCRCTCHA